MANYIDAFVFPIHQEHLDKYHQAATKIAEIWKEHGALAYHEYVGDDLSFKGTRAFPEFVKTKEEETIVFGWVVFNSREERDIANKGVTSDPRMANLIAPITDPSHMIFDGSRMVFGGFKYFI